ncbi:MAG: glycoside hydrolase family 27 protein [Eubacterium sp.]|nr:glycoside hydrolase family 27 protein [Eubacterium sp.]
MDLIRPPMGWNSFDCFGVSVNEAQVRANADFMAENLKDYGWEYVVVDIEWYSYTNQPMPDGQIYVPFGRMEMDEYSRPFPCLTKFPSAAAGEGFGPLASYVHGLGLKFGIHIMRGIPRIAAHMHSKLWNTELTADQIANPYSICEWNPDMYGIDPSKPGAQEYYDSLMELYAGWGVDFIKCDDICRMDAKSARIETEMIHRAIEKCSRDIVLSLSPGPAILEECDFYRENSEMWRVTDDFWDNWDMLRGMFDVCKNWQGKPSDEGFPDCDMLPIGRIGVGFGEERRTNFSIDEEKTMLTLWSIFRSPLMIGSDMPKLDQETINLLTNIQVLRLTEVSMGAREVYRDNEVIVWRSRDRYDDAEYVALFNISTAATSICPKPFVSNKDGRAVELWKGEEINIKSTEEIPGHGCLLIRVE